MCDRYFIEFPPHEALTPESLLEESLALVYPKDILLHNEVFFVPFERKPEKLEKRRAWIHINQRRNSTDPGTILRNNIRFMIKKTKHFGLLLSQLTWVGLMNFAEKRHVLHHAEDELRAAALYIIMLKKEESGLTQFVNCLHMTGNHEIANTIEAKLELLEEELESEDQYCYDHLTGFNAAQVEWHGHYLPPKKRKTSADSGFDDTDDELRADGGLLPVNTLGRRRYKCNIKPLDAVDVIAIVNGKEDSRCKVELCKCGHYHQYPKWKDLSGEITSKENNCTASSGLSKYFSMRKNENRRLAEEQPRQGILSPVTQPVEVGTDLSHGVPNGLEFTRSRRSCQHLRLRFSATNSFSDHPDSTQDLCSGPETRGGLQNGKSIKSKLPNFLRRFL